MGSKRAGVAQAFGDEVRQRFRFLVDQEGFEEPQEDGSGFITYRTSAFAVVVVFDQQGRYAKTKINGWAGDLAARTELSCLYVSAGLGPAQHVGWSAGTVHALVKTLDSQVAALRKLLPVLRGDERVKLLRECHGR